MTSSTVKCLQAAIPTPSSWQLHALMVFPESTEPEMNFASGLLCLLPAGSLGHQCDL